MQGMEANKDRVIHSRDPSPPIFLAASERPAALRIALISKRKGRGRFAEGMAGTTGLEPAASAVTGQRSNQLNYVPSCFSYG
jgi:hypothetical protein